MVSYLPNFIMNKKIYLYLALIALFSALLRIITGVELAFANSGINSVATPSLQTDMATYWDISGRIVAGTFKEEFYYQPFYYAVFLPIIRWILGDSIFVVSIIQALLGGAVVFLVGLCGNKLWNRQAGITAAILAALSKMLMLYTPFILLEILQSFWLILILYLALLAFERRSKIDWGLCAIALGCSILTRGNSWFFVPGILMLAVYSLRLEQGKTAIKIIYSFGVALIFIALTILPQLPFMIRNSQIRGSLTGPSTAAGAVLALGNTPEAPPGGRTPGLPPGPMEYPPTWGAWMSEASTVPIHQRIWQWFKEEPGAVIELTFRKLLLFWDYREIPNNIALATEGRQSKVLQIFGFMPTGLIAALALAGMITSVLEIFRKKQQWLLLLPIYMIAAFWAATALFYILARFRVPVIPLLAVFAGIFVIWFKDSYRIRKELCIGGGMLICGVFICFSAYDFYRYNLESTIIRKVRPDGVAVALTPGQMMYLDNGPFTFGDWDFIEFKPGMTITKKFAAVTDDDVSSEVEISFYNDENCQVILSVNGKFHTLELKRPGTAAHRFKLPDNSPPEIELKIISSEKPLSFVIDRQRNYGRTLINGSPVNGELVCRLFRTDNRLQVIEDRKNSSNEVIEFNFTEQSAFNSPK